MKPSLYCLMMLPVDMKREHKPVLSGNGVTMWSIWSFPLKQIRSSWLQSGRCAVAQQICPDFLWRQPMCTGAI
ncbi:hypothetical protein NQZ68_028751 [Dissostichus eleginoides]|nr:hypothetical protein NQZ68_028751 [Dissostichus eleginoides]